ncbi:GNAT family N-acetyltransferase [Pelomonas sp. KK5]|uniref:GNAT family N-acetyltransferase n=1 Tax=Pelomonas sp. KK5 TaxID=1855730 RepID=UPI00097BC05D|nr:GNAT family N-acetyltransferase [Pelomonas sp. KK5]
MTILTTARLRLEPITDAHFEGLHALNSDAEVMRYVTGRPDTPEDTWEAIERTKARWAEWGYSWWAFIEIETGELVGAGCVQHLGRDKANPHETGWRLRRDRWGRGYAIEAAREMARFAFEDLRAPELCAVCMPENVASSRVMERLGMSYRGSGHWYDMEMSVYGMSHAEWLGTRPA